MSHGTNDPLTRWRQALPATISNAEYREALDRQAQCTHFADQSPAVLIRMWETGCHPETGKTLNDWEFGALCEAWSGAFGNDFPDVPAGYASDTPARPKLPETDTREPLPEPDTMLDINEVERLTSLSRSSIYRMVVDGRFPPHVLLNARKRGWPARVVTAWLANLDTARYANVAKLYSLPPR